jgi:hypothetical protein
VDGWIKDYRQELESDIWMMPPLYHRVWQWIKYKVNHEDGYVPLKCGGKQKIEKGQHMTSIRQIAQGVGWYEGRKWKEPNPKTIRSILKWLEQQGMITITTFKGNNGYTLISVVNWEVYQSKIDESNIEHPFQKQETDINKNDNNDKNNIINNPADQPLMNPFEIELTAEQQLEIEIEDYYQTKRGKYGFPVTPKDHELIKQAIYKERFTRDEIIAGINEAFLASNNINSFGYCLKAIRSTKQKRIKTQQKKVVPMQPRPEQLEATQATTPTLSPEEIALKQQRVHEGLKRLRERVAKKEVY